LDVIDIIQSLFIDVLQAKMYSSQTREDSSDSEGEPQKEIWHGDPYDSDLNRIGDLDLTPWSMDSSDSEDDCFYLPHADGM
jgi:hypothetical protein